MSKTIREIIETMNDEQQTALYALVETAMGDDEEYAQELQQSDFDPEEEMESIFREAKRNGSLKDSYLEHAAKYGIDEIEQLFPETSSTSQRPHFINNRSEWVNHVLKNVHRLPFSRVKTMFSDISEDTLHAKGYTKTHKKVEDVISLLKRTTEPTTIYKKGKLDRDDIVDITDFDVVAWIKEEMRMKLDEEIARIILIGDGRDPADEYKIDEECIRPIYNDDDLFSVKVDINDTDGANRYKNIIASLVRSRKLYRGSGTPDLYTTDDVVAELLLLEDSSGKYIYKSEEELKSILRVKNIVIVNEMNGLTRTTSDGTKKSVYGIITNIADYAIGTDKGGQISMFDDFDIDYNQQKFLMETRCSGSLLKPYSALVIEGKFNGTSRPIVQGPPIAYDLVVPEIRKYVDAKLNSGSEAINYVSAILDLNDVAANKKVDTAEVEWKVVFNNKGNDVPASVSALLFASNNASQQDISGYKNTIATMQTGVVLDKEYTFKATYAASGNGVNLNTCRYLKPFLQLNKTTSGNDKTHGLKINSIKITVDGIQYDVTDTAKDFGAAAASSVNVVTEWVEEQDMPYAGKKAGFLGDSITFGMNPNITTQALADPWVSQMMDLCGFTESNNYGISSTTVADGTGYISGWSDGARQPMYKRYKTQMKDGLDVIGFKASINDFWIGIRLGTFDPTGNTNDPSTLYGALNILFKGLKEKYPGKKIFAMLPMDYLDKKLGLNKNPNGNTLDDFRNAIYEVADLYDIPVLDLPKYVGFTTALEGDKLTYIPDGLHPNQKGADKMAATIASFINTVL